MARSQPYHNPRPQLIAELNLMNLVTKHKLPLSTFQVIFNWAIKSQNTHGFDFSTANTRKRNTILKEICSNLNISTQIEYYPHIINWRPDNKPVQVFV